MPVVFKMIDTKVLDIVDRSSFTYEEGIAARNIIKKRKKHCLLPVHFAANLLDPYYRGKNLNSEELGTAQDCILEIAGHMDLNNKAQVVANIANYKTSSGHFSNDTLWEAAKHCNFSIEWWEGLCSKLPLALIAVKLMSVPPSSASCERNWSEWGRVDTTARNRTEKEKQKKQVTVMGHLNTAIQKPVKKEVRFSNISFEDIETEGSDIDDISDSEDEYNSDIEDEGEHESENVEHSDSEGFTSDDDNIPLHTMRVQ